VGNHYARALRALWLAAALALALIIPARALASPWGVFSEGSWCWFADPRAVHVGGPAGKTFAGWIDWTGGVTVGSYDPRTRAIHTRVVGHLYHDDHGSPALLVEPDRRITVFFSAHNGSRLYYRETVHPNDIRSWGPLRHVHSRLGGSKGFTYPNPVLVPDRNNELYLFWRGGDWGIDYATRAIRGHWHAARHLIAVPGQRPYIKVDGNGRGTIALAFTNGHPRERITSIYYAAIRNGSLWHADGRRITRLGHGPIAASQGDLVYNGDAHGASSWVWDVALDRHDRPVIVYATFGNLNDHEYWYARWTGRRWVSHAITFGGPTISPGTIETEYSGGIALDHSHPGTVYVSKQVNGWFEIERWTTRDGGAHWHHVTVVRTPGADNIRPVVPRDYAGGPVGLVWLHGHYGTYTTYRTSVAYLK
jgi:BNR repeat-containing family member